MGKTCSDCKFCVKEDDKSFCVISWAFGVDKRLAEITNDTHIANGCSSFQYKENNNGND